MYRIPRLGIKTESSIRNYLSLSEAPFWRKIFLHPWLPPEIGKILMLSDSAIGAAGDVIKMYYKFAFTSNIRGRHAVKELAGVKPINGSRVLDVGCAYGGFLVAAMHAGASSAVGIEINPCLASIANNNLSDNALSGKVRIVVGDALDGKLLDSLGKFDFVICNDVIEHVGNARLLVEKICGLLSPGGVAYLEIPNKRAASFLLSDGHYSLFGITVLPHDEARKYYEHCFTGKKYEDSMGEYYELEEYIDWFGQEGGKVEVLTPWRPANALEKTSKEYSQFVEELNTAKSRKIPLETLEKIRDNGLQYYCDYDADRQLMVDGGKSSDHFLRRYHDTFWRLVVRR